LRRFAKNSRSFSSKVGFIGLGNMGLPMSRNLAAAGFHVKGFDLNEDVRKMAAENGVTPVSSIAEVSKDVDYIVTALPKGEHVDTVLHQEGGVIDSANAGTYICDTSTISPLDSKRFHKNAAEKGLRFLDTPMSGGIMGAQNGTLTFMVGAPNEEDYEKAKIVLAGMGKNFFHCGDIGTGEIAKICNNMILGIQMVAVSEGMSLGAKLGIDSKKLGEILSVSTSSCWATNATNPVPGVVETSPASKGY
jgi:3-hydroxyisobutyrate dehydrogenase